MDNHDNHGIYDVFIKFMKSAWKKKKSGVGNMLSCMLGMLFLVMVMYLGLDMYARVNMAINKSRIERTYILYMETYGYLTPENVTGLQRSFPTWVCQIFPMRVQL